MITGIGPITLLVRDQDEALAFYTEKLGLEKCVDVVMGEAQEGGFRWLTVAPVGKREMEIVLILANTPELQARVGSQVADHIPFVLYTDDCRRTHAELTARGVHFRSEPEQEPWGTGAVLEDLYGNRLFLLQPAAP